MAQYDVIIIGAGPNGLAAGAYLSKAGLKVLLLERLLESGGGLACEECTLPRFIHNTHAVYHLMVEYAPPYKDLNLEKEGVRFVYPDLQFALPLSSGKSVRIYKDVEKTCASLAQFSRKDAETYREIYYKFQKQVDGFTAAATYVDPMPAPLQAAMLESTDFGREITEYSSKSPKMIVEELFENEHVRALMLYVAAHWGLQPDVDGVGYLAVLCLNRASFYRLSVGGSHSVAQGLIRVILDNKGKIRGSQSIKRIVVNNGVATGVELEDGQIIEANKAVISTLDPIQTFMKYVGKEKLPEEFVEKIENFKWDHWSLLTVHLALEKAPAFLDPEINNACAYAPVGIETEEELLGLWDSIAKGELLTKGFNCCFPSVHDPSQAPKGRHTGLISQMAPYKLKEGTQRYYNYKFKEEIAERCLETLRKYAPNMTSDNVLWTTTHTPLDIENRFLDMTEGSIKQGAYDPLQLGFLRPNEDCSNHRTPIKNLYLGGASSHSGGLVNFGPGYLVANSIVEDYGIPRWWPEPEIVTKAREGGLTP
jgi:phytoene dehydrogenase-like protein